ncbi:hypothetical protein [uncultured Catenibacterium sp.]|uniref:hypothetical protein n=1 Tax=uncultured Catenibacterium sp. TaxID=286142 RepID=UPI0025D0A509|nr:hypothetical protein [uncultured Catenibacterium sp.]
MSKYNNLWEYIESCGKDQFVLTFEEINSIAGVPLDHSFLKFKKELLEYGYKVEKISMKEKKVIFLKNN